MNQTQYLKPLPFVSFLVFATAAQSPPRTFQDGGFATGWQQLPPITRGAGGTSTVTRQASGASSGTFYQIDLTVNDGSKTNPSTVADAFINTSATYNPARDGAITSIDYSEDAITLGEAAQSQFTGPAILVTFTATVLPASATGLVDMSLGPDSVRICGNVVLSNAQAKCTYGFSVGTYSIRASYNGDSHYGGSTSAGLIQTVNAH